MPASTTSVHVPTAATTGDSGAMTLDTFLEGLDLRIVESGPAVHARKCSTDNGCDTQAGGDC